MNKKLIDEKVFETENFEVGQDMEVPIPGFFIIASKDKNKKKITEFSDMEVIELVSLQKKLRDLMEKVLGIEIVYFFQNEDSKHGYHVWCFPRLPWMEGFGFKIQSVRPIMNYAEENMFTEDNMKIVTEWCDKIRKEIN